MPSDEFSNFLNDLSKSSKEDGKVKVFKPGDLFFGSSIPYAIPSGLPEFDLTLQRPGWPGGRLIETFGFESSGKSSIALRAIAEVQKMGGVGLYIDTEKTFDQYRAEQIGVDLDKDFTVIEADSPESAARTALRIGESIKKSGIKRPVVIVIDSITGKPDEYTAEQELGSEPRLGQIARTLRQCVPQISEMASTTKATVFIVNHSIATAAVSGPRSTAAGGHSLKFWSSVRVNLAVGEGKTSQVVHQGKRIGQYIWVKLVKSKVGPITSLEPEKVELLLDGGFNTSLSLLNAMIRAGFITRKGTTAQYMLLSEDGEIPFEVIQSRRDYTQWEKIVGQLGGVDQAYSTFLSRACEQGLMRQY